MNHLVVQGLYFADRLDSDGELNIEMNSDTMDMNRDIWISRKEAQDIVNHLKALFVGMV